MRSNKKIITFAILILLAIATPVFAQNSNFPQGSAQGTTQMRNPTARPITVPNISVQVTQPQNGNQVAFSLRLLIVLTILTLAPSILILCTCFLRFSIVLDFIKRALSLQQVPPTSVLNGIALFMTLFAMWPTFSKVYENAYKPMSDGAITIQEAYVEAEAPLRLFMYQQMGDDPSYIRMFMNMAKLDKPNTLADVPTYVLVPSYILHELTVAFKIGILLYIPFILIDMITASILMAMGMMMLPPVQISMPFKLILFVMVDGWGILTQQLFNGILH